MISVPQTAATTLNFSSVFILPLCLLAIFSFHQWWLICGFNPFQTIPHVKQKKTYFKNIIYLVNLQISKLHIHMYCIYIYSIYIVTRVAFGIVYTHIQTVSVYCSCMILYHNISGFTYNRMTVAPSFLLVLKLTNKNNSLWFGSMEVKRPGF